MYVYLCGDSSQAVLEHHRCLHPIYINKLAGREKHQGSHQGTASGLTTEL